MQAYLRDVRMLRSDVPTACTHATIRSAVAANRRSRHRAWHSSPVAKRPAYRCALAHFRRPTSPAGPVDVRVPDTDDVVAEQWMQQRPIPVGAGVMPAFAEQLKHAYRAPDSDAQGVCWAMGIITGWAAVFYYALFQFDLGVWTVANLVKGIITLMLLEFLSTGLFITTHDAMHGAVCAKNSRLNHAIGKVCITLYACFDYWALREKHAEHHKFTGVPHHDPDYHKGDPHIAPWLTSFFLTYCTIPQLLRLQLVVLGLWCMGASFANMTVFWLTAGMLSMVRLFYFGTYLPHRPEPGGELVMPWYTSRTDTAPRWLSFLQCYHFNYHWEHHRWPSAPWWDLWRAKKLKEAALA